MTVNKKLLQVFSALLILVYHVWMPVGSGIGSQFIIRAGYIGVDMFFFLAAYSLADKDLKYFEFVRSRFGKIYLKFLMFTIVAALYKGWTIRRTLRILLFAEFFERGGGSFLWFIPAIMIFYLLYPLYLRLNPGRRVWYVLAGWLVLSLISQHLLGYTAIFIFTNRIPAMLAGSVAKVGLAAGDGASEGIAKVGLGKSGRRGLSGAVNAMDADGSGLRGRRIGAAVYAAMIPLGLVLLYFFGFKMKLNTPIKDLYFVVALPLLIGLAWLSGLTGDGPNRLINLLGNCTLELYALQVIFGTVVARAVYNLIGLKLAANLVTVIIIWLAAILVEKCWSLIQGKIGAGAN